MPKFNVHVFPIVRVKVANIEAETPEQAIGVADLAYRFRWKADHLQLAVEPNPHLEKEYAGFEDIKLLDFEDAEETSHYLVDPLLTIPEDHPDFGATNVDYDNSKWYDKDKKPTDWNEKKARFTAREQGILLAALRHWQTTANPLDPKWDEFYELTSAPISNEIEELFKRLGNEVTA